VSALDRINKARSLLEESYNELGDSLREITAQLDAREKRIAELEKELPETPKTKGGFAVGDRIQHKRHGHLGKKWHGTVISLRPPKCFSDEDITVQWDEGVGSDAHGFPTNIDLIEHENPKQNKAVQDSAVASADCRHWSKL
jgi:hypothetical protein